MGAGEEDGGAGAGESDQVGEHEVQQTVGAGEVGGVGRGGPGAGD